MTEVLQFALVLAAMGLVFYLRTRRAKEDVDAYKETVARLGFTLLPGRIRELPLPLPHDLEFFWRNRVMYFSKVALGKFNGVDAVLFEAMGSSSQDTSDESSALAFWSARLHLPRFGVRSWGIPSHTQVKSEFLLNLTTRLQGIRDLDIPAFPEFSKRHIVSGENAAQVQRLFTPELVAFIENHPRYTIEGKENCLLVTKNDALKLNGLETFAADGLEILSLVS